jgi:hypothetical protein
MNYLPSVNHDDLINNEINEEDPGLIAFSGELRSLFPVALLVVGVIVSIWGLAWLISWLGR